MLTRLAACLTFWDADDRGTERRAGLAGNGPYRYESWVPRLSLLVQESLKRDPHAGDLYVFRGRRGDLIKVIWHDGQGACLFTKRLERGRFIWPSMADGVVTISVAQMSYLLSGIDWRHPQETWRPQAAG